MSEPGSAVTAPGQRDARGFVGPPEQYDVVGANQFVLLVLLGLREHHDVLDVGCGSLRLGRLLLPYLEPARYSGVEPEEWLVREGVEAELGWELIERKQPQLVYADDFPLDRLGRRFDFIVAQSIFSHATPTQIEQCLGAAAGALEPDGQMVATFVVGDHDYTGRAWVYPECVTYTRERIDRFAAEAGLRAVELGYPHPGQQTWFAFTRGEAQQPALTQDSATLAWQLELANRRIERMMANPVLRAGMRAGRTAQRLRRRLGPARRR